MTLEIEKQTDKFLYDDDKIKVEFTNKVGTLDNKITSIENNILS